MITKPVKLNTTTEVYPVDIGMWKRYSEFVNLEQQDLQKSNLITIPCKNGNGSLKFIMSKYLYELNETVSDLTKQISIEDTETVLEDEVYYTAKIEGAKTTRKRTSELHNGAPIDKNSEYSERMTRNGFDAVKLLNLYGNRIDEDNLVKIWKVLTDGCCDNLSVQGEKYRIDDVYVGTFIPPSAEAVPALMKEWINFYNSPSYDTIPFIKTSILHFAFETIHPFCDGNGRMGRLLMNNYLIRQGIESARAVSFSMQIDKTRNHYDAAFDDAENSVNDITPFLHYMLDTMVDAYQTALAIQHNKAQQPKI
jgi:Fic family protein